MGSLSAGQVSRPHLRFPSRRSQWRPELLCNIHCQALPVPGALESRFSFPEPPRPPPRFPELVWEACPRPSRPGAFPSPRQGLQPKALLCKAQACQTSRHGKEEHRRRGVRASRLPCASRAGGGRWERGRVSALPPRPPLSRSPPRPSPGSLQYSDEDVTKYNDVIPAESSSLTEKPSEISDSQVRGRRARGPGEGGDAAHPRV